MKESLHLVGVDTALVHLFVADVESGHIVVVVLVGDVGVLGLFDGFDDDVLVFGAFFQFVDVGESSFAEGATRLVEQLDWFHDGLGLGVIEANIVC